MSVERDILSAINNKGAKNQRHDEEKRNEKNRMSDPKARR